MRAKLLIAGWLAFDSAQTSVRGAEVTGRKGDEEMREFPQTETRTHIW
jgi:hypothetical protein